MSSCEWTQPDISKTPSSTVVNKFKNEQNKHYIKELCVLPWDVCPMKLVRSCHQTLFCNYPWKEPQRSSVTIGHRNQSSSLESLQRRYRTERNQSKKSENCENPRSDTVQRFKACEQISLTWELSLSKSLKYATSVPSVVRISLGHSALNKSSRACCTCSQNHTR